MNDPTPAEIAEADQVQAENLLKVSMICSMMLHRDQAYTDERNSDADFFENMLMSILANLSQEEAMMVIVTMAAKLTQVFLEDQAAGKVHSVEEIDKLFGISDD